MPDASYLLAAYDEQARARDLGDMEHTFRLELLDADGALVMFPTPEGKQTTFSLNGAWTPHRSDDLKCRARRTLE